MTYEVSLLIDCERAEKFKNDEEVHALYNNYKGFDFTDGIYLKLKKNYKMLSKEERGYCYNYALKNKDIQSCEEGLEILRDKYKPIKLENIKQGDIVTFFSGKSLTSNNIWHFGIVEKTDNTLKRTIILSKWGLNGIFETNLRSLPEFYGNKICFWRKNG